MACRTPCSGKAYLVYDVSLKDIWQVETGRQCLSKRGFACVISKSDLVKSGHKAIGVRKLLVRALDLPEWA